MGEIEYNAAEAARYSELHPDATYVLATDYAALEAERDEWKRRCEETERLMLAYFNMERSHSEARRKARMPWEKKLLLAIAEGPDNG